MISLAEDIRDVVVGWQEIRWGMTEDEVREALPGRAIPITPAAKFVSSYAPFKASLAIEEHPFEVFPQFSYSTGELCQVLFRAADADAERRARLSGLVTAWYGPPVERGTKQTWRGSIATVELDTVNLSAEEKQLWLRWYPTPEAVDEA